MVGEKPHAGVLGMVAESQSRLSGTAAIVRPGARIVLLGLRVAEQVEWARLLTLAGALVRNVYDIAAARALPDWHDCDLLVASVDLHDGSLVELLGTDERLSFVAVADELEQRALSALLRHGPLDILLRPVDGDEVVASCARALRLARPRPVRAKPLATPPARGGLPELGLAGAAIARTRLPVLVVGETGTGKSRLARMLHETLTPHAPFVEVNTASLAGSLLASELFGHERGSFTGAHTSKQGLLGAAHGGTLFLDEIGELSSEGQAHLLSFLDTGVYRPVGGVRETVSDARVYCATNRDLAAAVAAGRFREDLYYRLASIVVPLPPLRQHPERIPELARELLETVARRGAFPPASLSPAAAQLLAGFAWPGNVRQLRFVMERLAALLEGETILPQHVEPLLAGTGLRVVPTPSEVRPLAQMERDLVDRAMQQAGGNRTRAAELLGITPRGLYNKLRRAGSSFREPA